MTRNIMLLLPVLILLTLTWACTTQPSHDKNPNTILSDITRSEDSIYQVAKIVSNTNPDSSLMILHRLLAQTNDSTTFYTASGLILDVQAAVGLWDSIYYWKSKAVRYCTTPPITATKKWICSKAYNSMGVYYSQLRQSDSSIYYFKKALALAPTDKHLRAKINIYINMGDSYFRMGELANGADYYRKAQHEADSIQESEYNFAINFGLGQIYSGMRDQPNANHYFNIAQQDVDERTKSEQYTYFNNRGNHHFLFGEYHTALSYFQKAHQLVNSADFKFQQNLTEVNLADTYIVLHNKDSASFYINRSYAYFKQFGHTSILDYINHIKAQVANQQGQYNEVKQILSQPISLNIEPDLKMLILKKRAELYANINDFALAYQNTTYQNQIRDSILNQQAMQRIADIDLRYKRDTSLLKKNIIIEQKQAKINKIQLSLLVWISLSVVLILAGCMLYISARKRHERAFYQYIAKITQLRMQTIRNKVSPHFIFNLLNREINRESSQHTSSERLLALSQMLRSSLDITETICVPLCNELDFIKNYITIEQDDLGDGFQFELCLDPTLDLTTIYIPSMILQIPIENSLKHGLRPLETDKRLWLHIDTKEEGIDIRIEDNGVGYGTLHASHCAGTGTGLKVIYQTIELLNRQNKKKMLFDIRAVHEGEVSTRVSIFIPTQYKYHLS